YPNLPNNLSADRAGYARELEANPALRERVLRIMANEQGAHPEGTQAIAESMMNRASVRHRTLEQEARWTSERGYYDDQHGGNKGVGYYEVPERRAILEQSLTNALGGSNASNYAYGNASAGTAAGKPAGVERTNKINGETFFGPNLDETGYL